MLKVGIVLWGVVAALMAVTWLRSRHRLPEVFRAVRQNGRIFLGVLPMALVAAGFLAPLIPGAVVARWLGEDAGLSGILIATLAGWVVPVPPVIFFPIVAALLTSGAGIPQMAALVAAWNVFSLHRTLPMELPVMGRYFVTLRLMSSLVIPPAAGVLALLIVRAA